MPTIAHYHRPPDLDTVWGLLRDAEGSARLLAGGSDLVLRCPPEVDTLIDLSAAGLAGVSVRPDGSLAIGAMTTFSDLLVAAPVTDHLGGLLHDVLTDFGSVLHRNQATVGGHVARARMSDLIPGLLAADAEVVVRTEDTSTRALADHLAAPPTTHVLTEVRLPVARGPAAGAFTRFSRSAFDHALLNVACVVHLDAGVVRTARVVVGETGVLGRRLRAAEAALTGRPLTEATIQAAAQAVVAELDPRQDALASADYRRHLAGVGTRRCLQRAAERLGEVA